VSETTASPKAYVFIHWRKLSASLRPTFFFSALSSASLPIDCSIQAMMSSYKPCCMAMSPPERRIFLTSVACMDDLRRRCRLTTCFKCRSQVLDVLLHTITCCRSSTGRCGCSAAPSSRSRCSQGREALDFLATEGITTCSRGCQPGDLEPRMASRRRDSQPLITAMGLGLRP
jgi:hypothetical protein